MVKMMTWDEAEARLADEQRVIEDHLLPLSAFEPTVDDDGQFGLLMRSNGRVYHPTEWAMKKMAGLSNGCREFGWMLEDPTHPTSKDKVTGDPKVLYARDRRDAELVCQYVKTHLFEGDRLDQSKPRLFRTWSDGTLRSVLSEGYQKVDNAWIMHAAREMVPDGKVIRWRGDADTLQFEVTLDHIQKVDPQSGYGGILHVGNSEIGQRSVIAHLGVLRMICTNGMFIMDKIASMHKRHYGDIDRNDLKKMFIETVEKGMPEVEGNIDKVLGLKAYGVGDVPLRNIFAQLGIDHNIGRKHIQGMWNSWMTESEIVGPQDAQTAFGIQQAITRFSQEVDREQSFSYDQIAGEMMRYDRNDWDKFRARAQNLSDKQINRRVGEAILVA